MNLTQRTAYMLRWPLLLLWLAALAAWGWYLIGPLAPGIEKPMPGLLGFAGIAPRSGRNLPLPFSGQRQLYTWIVALYVIALLASPLLLVRFDERWTRQLVQRGRYPLRLCILAACVAGIGVLGAAAAMLPGHDWSNLTQHFESYDVGGMMHFRTDYRWFNVVALIIVGGAIAAALLRVLCRNARRVDQITIVTRTFLALGIGMLVLVVLRVTDDLYPHVALSYEQNNTAMIAAMTLVLWALEVDLAIVFFTRRLQRPAEGQCVACGYDLRGSRDAGGGKCPECGERFAPAPAPAATG